MGRGGGVHLGRDERVSVINIDRMRARMWQRTPLIPAEASRHADVCEFKASLVNTPLNQP